MGPGGEVGGLAAIAFARHRFGGAFMDAARGLCVGIDGVSLERCAVAPHPAQSVSATMRNLMGPALLERPWDSVRPTSSLNIVSTTARLSATLHRRST